MLSVQFLVYVPPYAPDRDLKLGGGQRTDLPQFRITSVLDMPDEAYRLAAPQIAIFKGKMPF